MSSKLHRGGLPVDPMPWARAGAPDLRSGKSAPVPVYAPAGSATGGRTQADLEAGSYQRGLEEGKAAARREAAESVEAMTLKLARTIEELVGLRSRFRHEAEEDVVALSLAIARRVLHRELTVAPEALLGLIKAALEKMELREVHRVRVARPDAPMVAQYLEKMGLPRPIEVIPDPGLQRGSAILDSSRGSLDASVETQLAEIERGFADLVRRV